MYCPELICNYYDGYGSYLYNQKQIDMKKVVVAMVLGLMTMSPSFAGENPKLLKEIKRKLTLDLSQVKLKKAESNFVLVQFRVIDQEIQIIDAAGSTPELQEIMICELEDMFINSKSESSQIYSYKFTFEKE